MVLDKSFYRRDVLEVAPALIGKLLVREIGGITISARITQTEAYRGEEDTACHARAGRTERTQMLYREGGIAYVYLCYGIHCLFNVVTGTVDVPQAVLVRCVEGYEGPGKLTKALAIDRSLNGASLETGSGLYITDDGWQGSYSVAKRVGIDYATEYYRDIFWRFIMN